MDSSLHDNAATTHAGDRVARLWNVESCAAYLGKSPRWLWSALRVSPEKPGSIPHVRLGRTPRFLPEHISAWVGQGCPPAAMFRAWLTAEEKRQKRQ